LETQIVIHLDWVQVQVPPSGGSLEIGNHSGRHQSSSTFVVPPSGGSLEIGN